MVAAVEAKPRCMIYAVPTTELKSFADTLVLQCGPTKFSATPSRMELHDPAATNVREQGYGRIGSSADLDPTRSDGVSLWQHDRQDTIDQIGGDLLPVDFAR